MGSSRSAAPATYAVWAVEALAVQAPDPRVANWSTDPRSGTPGLPLLEPGVPAPTCLATVLEGRTIHLAPDSAAGEGLPAPEDVALRVDLERWRGIPGRDREGRARPVRASARLGLASGDWLADAHERHRQSSRAIGSSTATARERARLTVCEAGYRYHRARSPTWSRRPRLETVPSVRVRWAAASGGSEAVRLAIGCGSGSSARP